MGADTHRSISSCVIRMSDQSQAKASPKSSWGSLRRSQRSVPKRCLKEDSSDSEDDMVLTRKKQKTPPVSEEKEEIEETYDVEAVLGEKKAGGKVVYKVKWVGYDEPTWEPAAN